MSDLPAATAVQAALIHPLPVAVVPLYHGLLGQRLVAVGDRDGPQTDGSAPGKTFTRPVTAEFLQQMMVKTGAVGVCSWWSSLSAERLAVLAAVAAQGAQVVLPTAGHGVADAITADDIVQHARAMSVDAVWGVGICGAGDGWRKCSAAALTWPREWVWRLHAQPTALPSALQLLIEAIDETRPLPPVHLQSDAAGAGADADQWTQQARALLAAAAPTMMVYDRAQQHTHCPQCGETWVARRGAACRVVHHSSVCVCGQVLPTWLQAETSSGK